MDYKPRLLESEVEKYLGLGKSVVVVGPRQAGKTWLLKHLAEKHGGVFVNAEEPGAREFLLGYRNKKLLFVDEAQRLEDTGRILKLLHDRGVRFVATGSGSFDIKVKVTGELVGRAKRLVLLPLSFEEFLMWKDPKLVEQYREVRRWVWKGEGDPPFREHPALELLWKEFVTYGGYPEVVKGEEKRELLGIILENYVDKDIVAELGVRSRQAFINTLRMVAISIGSPLSKSTVAETVGINYRTVDHYLSLLTETFILFQVPLWGRPVESIRKRKKYYIVDPGVYNWLKGDFRPWELRDDQGKMTENYVARVLFQRFGKVYYFRKNGGEVDFVTQDYAVEVKTRKRRSRLLHRLVEEGRRGIVVYHGPAIVKDNIKLVPPWFI